MRSSLQRLVLAGLALVAALSSAHCGRSSDAPGAEPSGAGADCCELTPNAALPQGSGGIFVSYPGDGAESTRLEVYAVGAASEALGGGYGDARVELPPGAYDVIVGGRRLTGVPVQAGHDTRVRTGVLHVYAGADTRIDLLDDARGEKVAGGYGEKRYGLPVGPVVVEVAGLHDTALIEDGKVTEF